MHLRCGRAWPHLEEVRFGQLSSTRLALACCVPRDWISGFRFLLQSLWIPPLVITAAGQL